MTAIGSVEHNLGNKPEELEAAAAYLENKLSAYGLRVHRQEFLVRGQPVRNLEVVVPARNPRKRSGERLLVVGAHYDSAVWAPGANDNASGSAAVVELARLFKEKGGLDDIDLHLVLYVNEEPPYFRSNEMGSRVHAKSLRLRKAEVVAMLSLETMGWYSDVPGSQQYPKPLDLLYPDRGNFIGFVATPGSLGLVRDAVRAFRESTPFPAEGGAAPRAMGGIDWSDYASYVDEGFPAVMVTDTSTFRYPHYHTEEDTPDKLDYDKLARVVSGLEATIRSLAKR